MKVLIIDDEQEICILLKHILGGMNFKAESALTIQEGWSKYHTLHPGLMFLDINLPDGNGLDHVHDFKENGVQTLIVISGSDRQEDKQKALFNGADYFLHKPFSKKEVVDIIHRLKDKPN